MDEYFNANGRIIIEPFRTDTETSGKDVFRINFYKILDKFTYSIQANCQKRIFTKYPHKNEPLFDSVQDCKSDAYEVFDRFCSQNRLKKCFKRIIPSVFWQLDLFDEYE